MKAAARLLWMAEVAEKVISSRGTKTSVPAGGTKGGGHIAERVFCLMTSPCSHSATHRLQMKWQTMIALVMQSRPGRWVSAGRWWFNAV